MPRLAIIPARGGSKRIPNKNIRDFCGKPMIGHVLDAARSSALFDVVHVSTESMVIAEVAANLGFPVDFLRPHELADDFTPIMPVLKYVVEEYQRRGRSFDQIWLLMACAPLIRAQDLREADKLFFSSDQKTPVLAVSEYPAPIEWAFRRVDDGRLFPEQPGKFSSRSQDLEKKYYDAGSFAIFPTDRVATSQGAGSDEGYLGYILPKGSVVDIDDENDWFLAESLYRYRLKQSA